jgi:hypothetical protein
MSTPPLLFIDVLQGECSIEDYFSRLGIELRSAEKTPHEKALIRIWSHLKSYPLYGLYVPSGIFYHLGTSTELLNLITSPIKQTEERSSLTPQEKKLLTLCSHYGLRHHINSRLFNFSSLQAASSSLEREVPLKIFKSLEWNPMEPMEIISINSCLGFSANSFIGKQTLFENSVVLGDCFIGDHCVVSHISADFGDSLVIPSRTMIQRVPLTSPQGSQFVLIALGLTDDVKATFDSNGESAETL